ncbi:MAG: D-alanyl-D-alanine carboxypeptidase family protein [Candidatus Pacebacteria bacterium]|nr:D-alanyl-D-alanine carboxypeptidase family protein [Candidatus Paceibacterota bacterium]
MIQSKNQNYLANLPAYLKEAIRFDEGYFSIPLAESREDFASIRESFSQRDLPVSFDQAPGLLNQPKIFWVRQSLIDPLLRAATQLKNKSLRLHFFSAYRPLEEQKKLFETSVRKTIQEFPQVDKETCLKIAGVYVACNPATAAHVSGAAVDVGLRTLSGNFLDLGANYLDSGPCVATDSSQISFRARENRNLLAEIMNSVGFVNYPFEFWHFCFGDRIATFIQKKPRAFFGSVVFDSQKGIIKFLTNKEQKKCFAVNHLFFKERKKK